MSNFIIPPKSGKTSMIIALYKQRMLDNMIVSYFYKTHKRTNNGKTN